MQQPTLFNEPSPVGKVKLFEEINLVIYVGPRFLVTLHCTTLILYNAQRSFVASNFSSALLTTLLLFESSVFYI